MLKNNTADTVQVITVERFTSDDDATLSLISVDNCFVCFGLEDEFRLHKVAGETRIPAGTYSVKLRTEGGFHQRYSKRFPAFHKGMLWLTNVPNFEHVLIHIGNTDDDTAGCLLVGEGAKTSYGLSVTHSALAYEKLYRQVVQSARNESLVINIIDHKRGKA